MGEQRAHRQNPSQPAVDYSLWRDQDRDLAMQFFEKAFEEQMRGHLGCAMKLYQQSIDLCPTPEALTFLAWTVSHTGDLEQAVALCRQAIALDPEFGNPYNDMASYLMDLGRGEEAEPWLLRALEAPRYECRHYAWFNLGRLRETRGNLAGARECYLRSLAECPEYPMARRHLMALISRLN